jgi:hypothetical protein
MSEITRLPLDETVRAEFIEIANRAFERVLLRIEPKNVDLTKALWDAEYYIDNHLLNPEMLPISRDYALSLIDAFLPHYLINLAVEADGIEASPPALN